MKFWIPALLILVSPLCRADDGALEAAKAHIAGIMSKDPRVLAATYAPKITLMPGHEFLKERYGLAGKDGRMKALEVESVKLLEVMEKSMEGQAKAPNEQVEAFLKVLKFEPLEIKEGDFAVQSPNPTGTPDNMLHFQVLKDDVIFKVSPPRKDYIVLHLRQLEGVWRVVSECFD